MPRLSKEAAESYRHLGALKDQSDALNAKLQDLGATALVTAGKILGLISLPPIERAGQLQVEIDRLTASLAKIKGVPKELIDAKTIDQLKEIEKTLPDKTFLDKLLIRPSDKRTAQELIAVREEQERILKTVNQTKAVTNNNPLGLGKIDDVKKAQNEVQGFLATLEKQLSSLEGKNVELLFGPQGGLIKGLDDQFTAFKAKLQAEGLKPPAGTTEFFELLKGKIVTADQAYRDFKAAIENNINLDALDSLDKEFGEILSNVGQITVEQARAGAAARKQIEDLRKALAIEILPEDQQGNARIIQEVEERIESISRWRVAAIAGGQDVAQANEQAAQASAEAWVAAGQKMKETVDEQTEFARRAAERSFDAIADTLTDVLDNGFKGWTDFGEKVRKTLNKLAADFLTLQAKEALFGKDFGKKGGEFGGILGDLFGTKKAPAGPIPIQGTTAADVLDAERGQELAAAAQAAISTGATIAETTITTLGATTQTGITALQTTSIASIQAVEAVAIAAIQAQQAAGGAGGGGGIPFSGLFGGGGSSPLTDSAGQLGGALDFLDLEFGSFLPGIGHRGGEIADIAKRVLPLLHGGGSLDRGPKLNAEIPANSQAEASLKPGERLIIGEDGEFMLRKEAVQAIGTDKLEKLNQLQAMVTPRMMHDGGSVPDTWSRMGAPDLSSMNRIGDIPANASRNGSGERSGPPVNIFHLHQPNFKDRTSEADVLRRLGRTVRKSQKYM